MAAFLEGTTAFYKGNECVIIKVTKDSEGDCFTIRLNTSNKEIKTLPAYLSATKLAAVLKAWNKTGAPQAVVSYNKTIIVGRLHYHSILKIILRQRSEGKWVI